MKRIRDPDSESDGNREPPGRRTTGTAPITIPSTLSKPVSPPRRRTRINSGFIKSGELNLDKPEPRHEDTDPTHPNLGLSAIESGQTVITNHLPLITTKLSQYIRPTATHPNYPRLPLSDWIELYQRNQHEDGTHFVIHQHDHPIAGPHYDLRLQFSDTSSVSWSVMYGVPGDPNGGRRVNRNAIETRVHCLWNHLIETASADTGSMIIWDTGEYEVLPYKVDPETETETERDESTSDSSAPSSSQGLTESDKLREAFRNGKIRLRLHGTRLPPNYTIILRLDRTTDFIQRSVRTPRKRRRRARTRTRVLLSSTPTSSASASLSPPEMENDSSRIITPGQAVSQLEEDDIDDNEHNEPASASDNINNINNNDMPVGDQIRINNAYPGATNSIGSIHQRRWFMTLDRVNSGFVCEGKSPAKSKNKKWIRKQDPQTGQLFGFEPFYVLGPDVEKSIITGRLGREVLEDERVRGFTGRRQGWRYTRYL